MFGPHGTTLGENGPCESGLALDVRARVWKSDVDGDAAPRAYSKPEESMRRTLPYIVLLASTVTSFGADDPVNSPGKTAQAVVEDGTRGVEKPISSRWSPIGLTRTICRSRRASLLSCSCASGSTHILAWSFSGATAGQSVAGLVTGLPSGWRSREGRDRRNHDGCGDEPKYEDVYRGHLSQMVENAAFTSRYVQGTPVRTALPAAPFHTRTIVLESYYPVEPNAPCGCVFSGSRQIPPTRSPTPPAWQWSR